MFLNWTRVSLLLHSCFSLAFAFSLNSSPLNAPSIGRLQTCCKSQPALCASSLLALRASAGSNEGTEEPLIPPVPTDRQPLLPPMKDLSGGNFVQQFIMDQLEESLFDVQQRKDDEVVNVEVNGGKQEIGRVVRPKMSMIFTCNVCETRQMRSFTKLAYEKGIVIVTCKGCGSRHLIADNLGWYGDWLEKGDSNVQDIMARKGVTVPRIKGDLAKSLYEEWVEDDA